MPRHGAAHASRRIAINYRANVWAMRELGVRRIVGPGLRLAASRSCAPGTLGDRATSSSIAREGRDDTFHDGPQTTHVSAADPYCAGAGDARSPRPREEGIEVLEGGTMVVSAGPRFSTRAESRWFAPWAGTWSSMTPYPEAMLARELELCYAGIALVTDYDAGLEGVPESSRFRPMRRPRSGGEHRYTAPPLGAGGASVRPSAATTACANALSASADLTEKTPEEPSLTDFLTDHGVVVALVCAAAAVRLRRVDGALPAYAVARQRAHARDLQRRAGGRERLPDPPVPRHRASSRVVLARARSPFRTSAPRSAS